MRDFIEHQINVYLAQEAEYEKYCDIIEDIAELQECSYEEAEKLYKEWEMEAAVARYEDEQADLECSWQ